jgi:hypothetical protein
VNDLIEVHEALGEPEPPSQAAYAAARAALMQRAAAARVPAPAPGRRASRGSRARGLRHRRTGWLAGGLGLTAATAAAIAVIVAAGTPGGSAPSGPGNPQAGGISQLSGRQILLDAATAAATAPASTGTYWYVDELAPGSAAKMTTRSWYTHDGTVYTMIPQDKGVFLASPHAEFSIGASSLTYRQIQQLPTSPAALTAWITRSFSHPSDPSATPGGAPRAVYSPPRRGDVARPEQSGRGQSVLPRANIPSAVAISLSELLDQIPAPRAVRAAAFRALAAMPDVTKLDEVGGDVVLRISVPALPASKFPGGKVPAGTGEIKLIIDASTLTLHAWSDYTGTTTILAARWTNTLPRIIPDSQLASPSRAKG